MTTLTDAATVTREDAALLAVDFVKDGPTPAVITIAKARPGLRVTVRENTEAESLALFVAWQAFLGMPSSSRTDKSEDVGGGYDLRAAGVFAGVSVSLHTSVYGFQTERGQG